MRKSSLFIAALSISALGRMACAQSMDGMQGMDPGMDMSGMARAPTSMPAMSMPMTGVLGAYPMTREASGTSWQPDASTHDGVHGEAGGWSLMGHALLTAVYDRQSGPRGDDKGFLAGMVMGTAHRTLDGGVLNLRAMLSPDPLMGPSGYPLLLAAGETADGRTPLVDRQHPHDLIMELSAAYSHPVSEADSLYIYAGLPGEPAFGPPAFMHRQSTMDSPEAPISHHWLDSTHITFGVVTAGWVHAAWKLEASRFNGREPDQHRYDIESPNLDSTAARLSWNPAPRWALQASWADQRSPEALEPTRNEKRWSTSAIYTRPVGAGGLWSTTLAWGRKVPSDGPASDALAAETALKPNANWTLFARAERVETDELNNLGGAAHGSLQTVGKASFGAIRDWRLANHAKVGIGGLYSLEFVPKPLEADYGQDPTGAMAFVRLVID